MRYNLYHIKDDKYRGAGYKDRQVVVYKAQQVAGYKVSLFFEPRKWLFIRSHFLHFRSNNFQIFPKMDDYKVPRVFCDSHFNQLPCEKSSLLPIYHEFSTFSWFFYLTIWKMISSFTSWRILSDFCTLEHFLRIRDVPCTKFDVIFHIVKQKMRVQKSRNFMFQDQRLTHSW